MKKIIAITLLCLTTTAMADKYVNGYVKRDGTYVEGHFKSDANNSKFDNYSTQGNTNPYTGQKGYVDPYKPDNNYQQPNSYISNPYGR